MSDEVKQVKLEEVKKICNHVGFISSPSQSLFVTDMQIMVVNTTSCTRCGHLFTNMTPINLQGPGTLAIPNHKLDPKIFKP